MLNRALNFLGYKHVLMKDDQEPAIVRLLEHVRDYRGPDAVHIGIEHSPVKDSQANGMVE